MACSRTTLGFNDALISDSRSWVSEPEIVSIETGYRYARVLPTARPVGQSIPINRGRLTARAPRHNPIPAATHATPPITHAEPATPAVVPLDWA